MKRFLQLFVGLGVASLLAITCPISAVATKTVASTVLVVSNTSTEINGSVLSPTALNRNPGRDGISLIEAVSAAGKGTTIRFASKLAGKVIPYPLALLRLDISGVSIIGFTGAVPSPIIVTPIQIEASSINLQGIDVRSAARETGAVVVRATSGEIIRNVSLDGSAFAATGPGAHTLSVIAAGGGQVQNLSITNDAITNLMGDAISVELRGNGSIVDQLTVKNDTMSNVGAICLEVRGIGAVNTRVSNTSIVGNKMSGVALEVHEPVIYLGWFGAGGGNSNNVIVNTTIANNIFWNYGGASISLGASEGDAPDEGNLVTDAWVVNNLFSGNSSLNGFFLYGVGSNRVQNVHVINDTIMGTLSFNGSVTADIVNTILGGVPFGGGATAYQIRNSLIAEPNPSGGYVGQNGNLNGDPSFEDSVNGDFHLRVGSPAINAGTLNGSTRTDLEGKLRSDGHPDIGAYEFTG